RAQRRPAARLVRRGVLALLHDEHRPVPPSGDQAGHAPSSGTGTAALVAVNGWSVTAVTASADASGSDTVTTASSRSPYGGTVAAAPGAAVSTRVQRSRTRRLKASSYGCACGRTRTCTRRAHSAPGAHGATGRRSTASTVPPLGGEAVGSGGSAVDGDAAVAPARPAWSTAVTSRAMSSRRKVISA